MWLRSAMAKYVCAGEREIVVHLTKIWGFVCCPKLCACFHALCLHTSMCMLMNIIEELRRPNLRFTESFVKIWHSFAEIWGFVYRPRFSTCLHSLCMHACMCMPMNINYQLRNWILSYTKFFVKIWLPFGWDMRVCLLPHKLRAGFHVLCMHASMCTPMNILNLGICWNFCEDRTSFGWDIRVCLPPQVVCTFSRAVRARMHVNARMCMPMNIINQLRRLIMTYTETLWKSYFIWLRYKGLFTTSSYVHVFTHCACTQACACPWTLLINWGYQFWHMLKVLWRSDFICLINQYLLKCWYGTTFLAKTPHSATWCLGDTKGSWPETWGMGSSLILRIILVDDKDTILKVWWNFNSNSLRYWW